MKEDGAFEIRRYDDLVVATTTVEGDLQSASTEGLKRLAGYIFGHNHRHLNFTPGDETAGQPGHKMAMTARVIQYVVADLTKNR